MSNGNDNLNYDDGALMASIKQAGKSLSWVMNINAHENIHTCGPDPNVSNHGERTEVESKLRNLHIPASKDPNQNMKKVDSLPYIRHTPPWLCERALDPNIPFYTPYQQQLRQMVPEEVGKYSQLNEFIQTANN